LAFDRIGLVQRGLTSAAFGLAIVFVCHAPALAQPPAGPRKILIVNYYGSYQPAIRRFDDGALDAIGKTSPDAVDFYFEYLDLERDSGEREEAMWAARLREKYGAAEVSVVLAVADGALVFLRKYGLFPGVPMVAVTQRKPYAGERTTEPNLFRLWDGPTAVDTVAMALQLHPQTRRLLVLCDRPTNDGEFELEVRTQLERFTGRLDIEFATDLPLEQILARVRALPPDALVLVMRLVENRQANRTGISATTLIAQTSAVPVYALRDVSIGAGPIGGHVADLRSTGQQATEIAVGVALGARIADLPPQQTQSAPMFDARQLQRWGLNQRQLPPGSLVLFHEPGFWEHYGGYVIVGLAVGLMQMAFIAGLLVQRNKRRDTEVRNAAILRAMPDAMFLQTKDGVYVDYHAPTENQLLLVSPSQFMGKNMRDVLPADVAAMFAGHFARLTAGQEPTVVEYALQMPDGQRQYEARLVPYRNDQVLSIVRDITVRKQAEVALHEAQAELTRVSRLSALGQFAATIAHEVRQPLTAIIMTARTCLRWLNGAAPDLNEVRSAITDVVDASQRADEIIRRNRDLLKYHTVQKAPLDINGVIREVVALTSARLLSTGCALYLTLDTSVPVIKGDRVELQQVLLNLIGNGVDAMEDTEPGARRIGIKCSVAEGGDVQVSVRDTGIGLSGVDMRRIFTPLYTTKVNGTGVGLSISRSIIEAHGGHLWAEANPDRGANFLFTLPAESAASGSTSEQLLEDETRSFS
jgi:signal transduction histidine kinase